MTDLLENELVQKYFGECGEYGLCGPDCIARRVLSAMKKPIAKGDLILERFPANPEKEWRVMVSPKNFETGLHEAFLRLPDRFQTEKDCEHKAFYMKRWYATCSEVLTDKEKFTEKPDPVEMKIREILSMDLEGMKWARLEKQLSELVELARKQP